MYTTKIDELLEVARLNPLGPGTPNEPVRPRLAKLQPEEMLAPHTVHDRDMAHCCMAGLWLHHDFLEEAHSLSQDIATAEGSFWHGIMHRREGDFSNAKYWFRRVGTHPVFAELHAAATRLASELEDAQELTKKTAWDPYAFIDLCERAQRSRTNLDRVCRHIQQAEWRLLFEYCYRKAIAC